MSLTDYMSCNVENFRNYVAFISVVLCYVDFTIYANIIGEQVVVIFIAK